MSDNEFYISPSLVGEYVQHGKCPMYARLGKERDEISSEWDGKEAFKPLNQLLSVEGERFEREAYEKIKRQADDVIHFGKENIQSVDESREKMCELISEAQEKDGGSLASFALQPRLNGKINCFNVDGEADLIGFWPQAGNHVNIKIFDIKRSWDEKVYHQIQTAIYSLLVKQLIDEYFSTDSKTFTVEAGIITKESVEDIDMFCDEESLSFDLRPREEDVSRLFSESSELADALRKDFEDVGYQIDSVCEQCSNNEYCFTNTVEAGGLELLGISRNEQETFTEAGLEDIFDVAKVAEIVDESGSKYVNVHDKYKDSVQAIEEDGFSGDITQVIQNAKSLVSNYESEQNDVSTYSFDGAWKQEAVGREIGAFPGDKGRFIHDDAEYSEGGLVRVYLNVQHDFVFDTIASVSAQVESSLLCEEHERSPINLVEMVEDIEETQLTAPGLCAESDIRRETAKDEERRIVQNISRRIFEAIETVGRITDEYPDTAFHFYVYTNHELSTLKEGLTRNSDIETVKAFRDILEHRAGIEQSMVSVVEDVFDEYYHNDFVSTGLVTLFKSFFPDDLYRVQDDEEQIPIDGTKHDLQDVFIETLFDYSVMFKHVNDAERTDIGDEKYISILFQKGDYRGEIDGWYPLRGRFGAQIPLEYIWGCKEIEAIHPTKVQELSDEDEDAKYKSYFVNKYLWYDTNDGNKIRIRREHVCALLELLTSALRQMVRGMNLETKTIKKEALHIPEITSYKFDNYELVDAASDYLNMEYHASVRDMKETHMQPLKQRIREGRAIPLLATTVNRSKNGGVKSITGQLAYNMFNFASPDKIAASCREGEGDWMVATPLEWQDDDTIAEFGKTDNIENNPIVKVSHFDAAQSEIEIEAIPYSIDGEFSVWHKTMASNDADDTFYNVKVNNGDLFVLDSYSDDVSASRASAALENIGNNTLYHTMTNIIHQNKMDTINQFDASKITEFVNWLQDSYPLTPNVKQQQLIKDCDSQIHLLQGPPGTGKTSGPLSLSIVSRIHATDGELTGLVTGASNKSIDEVMEDVSTAFQSYSQSFNENVNLIRLTSSTPDKQVDGVEYLNYNVDKERATQVYNECVSPSLTNESIVLFATPSAIAKFVTTPEHIENVNDAYSVAEQMFDLLAVDEASMMPIPRLLAAGAFVKPTAQIVISGDQRQMSPVQKHDWKTETREQIATYAPYLSTLDYFRLLKGETPSALSDEHEDTVIDVSADIPITRLNKTYRCHEAVARFLKDWVYERDNINFISDKTETLSDNPVFDTTELGNRILQPDSPITLLLYDDTSGRQSNIVEAYISKKIVESLPDDITSGIVTPHNSQKGLLSTLTATDSVDTVERFQGGERDAIVVSTTVSDPDYISKEEEFLLNLNRLNVAVSRMKQKLLVIAPQSIFEVIPDDVDVYNESLIWKGLYNMVNAQNNPDEQLTLGEISNDAIGTQYEELPCELYNAN